MKFFISEDNIIELIRGIPMNEKMKGIIYEYQLNPKFKRFAYSVSLTSLTEIKDSL